MLFLQFCSCFGIDFHAPSLDDLGAFTEWLINSGLAPSTVRNHLSSVKTLYVWWSKPSVVALFRSDAWSHMIRGISNTVRPSPPNRSAMSIPDLMAILSAARDLPNFLTVRVGILFGFFGYLRVSNLAQARLTDWDPSRHPTWADVATSSEGVILSLRWSKTRQHSQDPVAIPMAALGSSPLCPLRAWVEYRLALESTPFTAPVPLLVSTSCPIGSPVTIPQFRAALHRVAAAAGLSSRGYTPHSLRRGSATFSYQAGVQVGHIKTHGTWLSNAVNAYLQPQPKLDTPVTCCFGRLLFNFK